MSIAWEAIENFAQGQKEWNNPPNIISEQEVENLKTQEKRLFGNENVWAEMHRGIAWDKVENLNPQSTLQVLPSFEENTSPVTYPDEVKEIIGILIEVKPLDETPLEDLGLNTCNHDILLSSRKGKAEYHTTDYAALNQLYKDFSTRFVPQTELSVEQAFWSQNSVNSSEPTLSIRPTNVEVPKELPKVSMVNTSLKKLKHHLANFDVVVKERTTPTDHYLRRSKALVDNNVSNHPSDPELHQVNVEPITPKLLNKRTAHSAYIKHSQEEAAVNPLDPLLESACKYTKLIQEMLSKISKTYPSINGEQLGYFYVAVTPMNKVKRVRFTEPVTSSRNTKIAHTSNLASNKPMLSSTGVKQSTSASGSQPSGNTKKDKIQQTPSSTLKNKHSKLNANYELKCVKCNGCMLSDNHDLCVLEFINNVNARAKSRSVKKNSKRKVWKPTGKVFTNIGYIWRPTGRTFTIVENACPLTKITTTTEVPLRKSSALDNKTPKPVVTLVYSRKPRNSKTSVSCRPNCSSLFGNPAAQSICPVDRSQLTNSVVKSWGKSMKKPHKPKSEDTNQEKLYLLHMDLCGPMRVASVNGKKYIIVIVDDYSRFTWVKCLRSKDEAPAFIINFLKMIQVRLKETVRHIRTDNGTEFVNQTLREYYEKVGISHETSVARSPQQNGVVERRNHTLIEAAHTMLIYAKAPLFLWAKAVASTCENLGKLQPKADIGIFIGYAPTKKAFQIYNRRTRRIVETIHVDFDELTAMASEHSSSGHALHEMTPATISSGLVPNLHPLTPFVLPSRTDWDILFQPLFDELFNPPLSVDFPAPEVIAPIDEVVAPEPAVSTSTPSSTTVDQDAPSPSNSQTTPETEPPIIPNDVEENNHDIEVAHMGNDSYFGVPIPEIPSD
ncbi:retrovirus-related pol polyprotein from transposon TNT 1-94, partial [Tanacetum coccineum]